MENLTIIEEKEIFCNELFCQGFCGDDIEDAWKEHLEAEKEETITIH